MSIDYATLFSRQTYNSHGTASFARNYDKQAGLADSEAKKLSDQMIKLQEEEIEQMKMINNTLNLINSVGT